MCGRCGHCDRCKRAAYMRNWWAQLSPERKREYLDKRAPDTRKGRRSTPDISALAKRAHWTVHNAIRDRRLERQPCEVCGEAKTDAHHEDYARPLDVRWLCRKHHGEQHRKYNTETRAA